MKCKVGDLAVVISAEIRSNIGRIVRVVAPDTGVDFVAFRGTGKVWTVTCHQRMTWRDGGKRYNRKTGPVPDSRLQPIRGPMQGAVDALEKALRKACKRKGLAHITG